MIRYGLYLGCTVPVRGLNYEMAARKVCERLGIQLVDVEGFSCCGFPVRPLDWQAGLVMAARNLALAEEAGVNVMALCSACTEMLTEANYHLREDPELLAQVNEQLAGVGRAYHGTLQVRHFARVLYQEVGLERLREEVTRPLEGFAFASHYGCHYLKPSYLYDGFDDPENPQSLDRLIQVTGARVVRYEGEEDCCGGGILAFDGDTALWMTKRKLDHVTAAGADALILTCPFCAIMYEANQRRVEGMFEVEYKLPVLYYPQILGLAMGFSPDEMGFRLNRVKPRELIKAMRAG